MRFLLVLATAAIVLSSARAAVPGLSLADGRPVVGVYYFGHWWDPWKSNDDAILRDFARLRAMGVTVLFCDHEWSQAIDGDWRWLDREQRLAKEAGLVIVPWLSSKTFSDIMPGARQELAKKWYGVNLVYGCDQSGKPTCPLPYDPATVEFAVKWTKAYIDRYRNSGALARVKFGGREGIWVAPTVEIGWPGPGSFDSVTGFMFDRWLRTKYGAIAHLNKAWGTHYATWWDIDQRDTDVFDYKSPVGHEKHPVAIADRTDFCSQVLGDSLSRISAAIHKAVPDVIIGSEIPYQLGSQNPDAISYVRQYCCEPVAADHAQILVVRATGLLTPREIKLQDAYRQAGRAVVLTFRTYGDVYTRDKPEDDMDRATFASKLAEQARDHADGFGFYSWNELVDTHVAAGAGGREAVRMSEAESARAVDLLKMAFADYLK